MLMNKIKEKIDGIMDRVTTFYSQDFINNLTINSNNDEQDLLNYIRAN
jgi:hypothetical protein